MAPPAVNITRQTFRTMPRSPWEGGASLWLKARQPTEIGGSDSVLPPAVDLDPIARVALEQLTRHVNLGTGLTHPSDRGYAIETVQALHPGRRKLSPDDAHAWAMHPLGPDDVWHEGDQAPNSANSTSADIDWSPVVTAAVVVVAVVVVVAIVVFAPEVALPALAFGLL